jgi:hypothetical protein
LVRTVGRGCKPGNHDVYNLSRHKGELVYVQYYMTISTVHTGGSVKKMHSEFVFLLNYEFSEEVDKKELLHAYINIFERKY